MNTTEKANFLSRQFRFITIEKIKENFHKYQEIALTQKPQCFGSCLNGQSPESFDTELIGKSPVKKVVSPKPTKVEHDYGG